MKEYIKPFIEDENIEIEDVCVMSNKGVADVFSEEDDADDLFGLSN